jgi:hypothetical protein
VGSVVGGMISRLFHLPVLLDFAVAIACAALLIWFFRRRRSAARTGVEVERRG